MKTQNIVTRKTLLDLKPIEVTIKIEKKTNLFLETISHHYNMPQNEFLNWTLGNDEVIRRVVKKLKSSSVVKLVEEKTTQRLTISTGTFNFLQTMVYEFDIEEGLFIEMAIRELNHILKEQRTTLEKAERKTNALMKISAENLIELEQLLSKEDPIIGRLSEIITSIDCLNIDICNELHNVIPLPTNDLVS